MKNIQRGFLFVAMCVLHLTALTQTTPEALLGQLPAVPNAVCAVDTSVVNSFTNRIYLIKASLQQATDRIHASAQGQEEKLKNKALSNATQQLGLSKDDLKQLQQEDIDEAEAQKIAEKTVSKQSGYSLQELEKVGAMSEGEQQKWAQKYAAQQMQRSEQNSKSASTNQEKNSRLFDLAKEQKTIGERITAKMAMIAKLFREVEQQDTIETRKLNEKLPALEKQLCSGICTPAEIARSKAAEKQIYNLRLQYCQKMSPMQVNALSQYLTCVKMLFPDYRQLAKVQNEIVSLQFGAITPVDLSCYSAIDEYATALLESYKYQAGKFEQ